MISADVVTDPNEMLDLPMVDSQAVPELEGEANDSGAGAAVMDGAYDMNQFGRADAQPMPDPCIIDSDSDLEPCCSDQAGSRADDKSAAGDNMDADVIMIGGTAIFRAVASKKPSPVKPRALEFAWAMAPNDFDVEPKQLHMEVKEVFDMVPEQVDEENSVVIRSVCEVDVF